jgi:hypothetical protein
MSAKISTMEFYPASCPVSKADQRVQVAAAASPARPVLSSSEELVEFREEAGVAPVDLDQKRKARPVV